ncbi:hypothetical protein CAGGBEG34_270073 [Candidatus Glomeribacter gigasporarum BEG34]|uniref:Uncharacterized protein n=1 Tax=Candidatus Glomeribacter gigasporarum BEG34 TaxID=1070319 RepID=G2JA58_9BURK|nr:hypothetical protein [Candidatus Glomeribacter gigasporarum]CCD29658.1 hypothetical protein CAGGBEG34_270073 [Candidatus Glomeribacter gigasporarum BEG34]
MFSTHFHVFPSGEFQDTTPDIINSFKGLTSDSGLNWQDPRITQRFQDMEIFDKIVENKKELSTLLHPMGAQSLTKYLDYQFQTLPITKCVDKMLYNVIINELHTDQLEENINRLSKAAEKSLEITYSQSPYQSSALELVKTENKQLFDQIRRIFEDLIRTLNPGSYRGKSRADLT